MAIGRAAAHILDVAGKRSMHGIEVGTLTDRLRGNLEGGLHDSWCHQGEH
jgi:hypothetical protein